MENENLISITEFCRFHHVDVDFIQLLQQNGLIETTIVQQTVYVQTDNLGQLEKFVRSAPGIEYTCRKFRHRFSFIKQNGKPSA